MTTQNSNDSSPPERKKQPPQLVDHAFKPGKSGNPAGRPKAAFDFRAEAREWIQARGKARLYELAEGNTRDAYRATELLFAYGLGKPPVTFQAGEDGPLTIVVAQIPPQPPT